jgi:hypothetical protein
MHFLQNYHYIPEEDCSQALALQEKYSATKYFFMYFVAAKYFVAAD